ncbi:hypothetical protein D9615_002376 [Tricholomella constricta]|uniref:Uncharacterized protein n=1 Tax=Tricholomella constricta TaxID=117010 RepID=A0A8H5HMG0_9AGAR|nr:hypothetical protein D9615_002376 [Tricholomella constricta]
MHDKFLQCLANRYLTIRAQYPGEGRRKWHLRVLQEFWESVLHNETNALRSNLSPDDDFTQDDDPFDHLLEGQELGILLRTDYSNEDAWQSFCTRLQSAESELAEAVKKPETGNDTNDTDLSVQSQPEDSDSDRESLDGVPFPIIKVVDPSPQERTVFHNISNLSALRLLNDVDIRPAPNPPAGESRIRTPNRLIDQGTWQEIYSGMNLWIYDAQSNTDQCVKLVGQEGDIYGTATGDSWRVQGPHICDLQFKMSFLGMTINFGGLDRWDYGERRRNLEEANQNIGNNIIATSSR